MEIIGHGVDLVEVGRIRDLAERHGERFFERCFTAGERAYADSRPKRRFEHYAARFAAKEALLKALGTGLRNGISWTDIEVRTEPSGRPGIALSGRCAALAREAGIDAWFLSMSHTEAQAIASVIAARSGDRV